MRTRTKRTDAQVSERLARRDQDRTDWQDGVALRAIEGACHATEVAERALAEAVNAAREEGYSWAAIGLALGGVSKQAAQQRFAS